MTIVKRYDYDEPTIAAMLDECGDPAPAGEYVLYSDYSALAEERDRLVGALVSLLAVADCLDVYNRNKVARDNARAALAESGKEESREDNSKA